MTLLHSPNIVRDGLVLYLDAANSKSYPGTGTTWKDLSSMGAEGVLTNSPVYSNDNKGNFYFDGSDDFVDIDGYNFGSSDITIVSWIFKNSNAQSQAEAIISKSESGKREFHFRIEDSPTNGIYLWKSDTGAGAGNIFDTGIPISLNKWQNIVVSANNSSVKFYINGINVKSYSGSYTFFNGDGKIRVAGWSEGTGWFFNGSIPLILVYNRSLTESEIKQNFNALRGRYGI